jgi:hypothetical protein
LQQQSSTHESEVHSIQRPDDSALIATTSSGVKQTEYHHDDDVDDNDRYTVVCGGLKVDTQWEITSMMKSANSTKSLKNRSGVQIPSKIEYHKVEPFMNVKCEMFFYSLVNCVALAMCAPYQQS